MNVTEFLTQCIEKQEATARESYTVPALGSPIRCLCGEMGSLSLFRTTFDSSSPGITYLEVAHRYRGGGTYPVYHTFDGEEAKRLVMGWPLSKRANQTLRECMFKRELLDLAVQSEDVVTPISPVLRIMVIKMAKIYSSEPGYDSIEWVE